MLSPKVSIIVLCYNGLEETTRPCLESIIKNTADGIYELIVVDNASSDGTVEYLKRYATSHPHIQLHLNEVNKGYAGGNNDGIRLAKGHFIILLNNDTLVTEGWLDGLLRLFEIRSEIGLIGPITNSAGNEQRIELNDLNEANYEEVSAGYIKRQKGVWFTTEKLGFFCVAMRAEVPSKIGLLDEKFGLGMFEDDDYCVRAKNAGFELAITEECFVYHKGSMSFKRLDTEKYISLFNKNRDYFFDKHNILWTYTDIADSIFKRIYLDLNSFLQVESQNTHLERVRNRLESLKNSLLHLREVEKSFKYSDAQFLSEINLLAAHRNLMEISDIAFEKKVEIDQISSAATKLSEENAILHQELASLRAQIPNSPLN